MNSIVIELQRDALNEEITLTSLLRKARVIAQKLSIPDLISWTEAELQGYKPDGPIPEYRRVRGELKSWNPYNGIMCPIMFTGDAPDYLTTRLIAQSVSELLDLQVRNDGNGSLTIAFPENIGYKLMQQSEMPTPPVLVIDRAALAGILDTVRSMILDWSVKLESQGILGEGMTFSNEEKSKAMKSTNIHIGNFQGVLGDVANSTVTQNLNMSIPKGDFASLSKFLTELKIQPREIDELKIAIDSEEDKPTASNFGPKVSGWMGNMLGKAADGSWKITLGAAANLLSDALKAYYGV